MENEILNVIDKFQKGYKNRDVKVIDKFIEELFIDSEDITVIGTAFNEWCKGKKELSELLYIDWFYWGNFELDLNDAHIYQNGNSATFLAKGILQKEFNKDKVIEHTIGKIENDLKEEVTDKEKLLKALKSISYYLHEEEIGKDVKRRVRFSASLVKENAIWKISNMHFSYPVSPPTDVKLT